MRLSIEVSGDKELQAAFVQLIDTLDDLSPVIEAIGDQALADIRGRIDNHPGPPLSAKTIKAKGHAKILRDSDGLYASFQKGGTGNITRITPTEGEFGSNISYGVFHQAGTGRMPRRTVIEITGEQEARYTRVAVDFINRRARELGF